MFSFHEIPSMGQRTIINNAIRVASKSVIIVDISRQYEPSELMLSGEPYLQDYLNNFENLLSYYYSIGRGIHWKKTNVVNGHVDMWEYTKTDKRLLTQGVLLENEKKIQIMSDRAFWKRRRASFNTYPRKLNMSYSHLETWNDPR